MNRLQDYIVENIPDPVKIIFFFGSAFAIGYVIGDFGYDRYDDVVLMMCKMY